MQIGLGWRSVSAPRCGVCAAALAVALTLSAACRAWAAPGDTTLVSRASGTTGATGNGLSQFPAISGDGRLVVFASKLFTQGFAWACCTVSGFDHGIQHQAAVVFVQFVPPSPV